MTYMVFRGQQSVSNNLEEHALWGVEQIVKPVVEDLQSIVIVANSIDQEINSTSQVDAQQVPFNFSHKANVIMQEGN